MDRELHEELTAIHVQVGLVVQRTEELPRVLKALNDRVTELEASRAEHELVHKKLGWTFAGASGAVTACWAVAYFVFREMFR